MAELEKYQQIFERDPTDLHAFINVCRAAEKAKDFEYLTELLKYRTQITGDQAEIVDLLFRAGVVYIEKMNDVARGVEVLLQAFDIDQTHAGIGARLESAYINAGDFDAALAIIEGRLNSLGQADVDGTKVSIRSDLHQQAGELLQDRVGDMERALGHYRKAIELDKTNAVALSRAREIYLQAGKIKNAAKLCELEARVETDVERKIRLYRELADILGNRMNDKAQAVTALKRALKVDQNNDDVKLELALTIADSKMDASNAKDHKWASDYLTRRAKHVDAADGLQLACAAIRAYPDSEKALSVAGSRARETRNFQPLIDECKRAIATMNSINEQAPLIRRIVKSYLRMGIMGDALVWAEKLEPVADEKDRELIIKLKESSFSGNLSGLDSDMPGAPASIPPDSPAGALSVGTSSVSAVPAAISSPPEVTPLPVALEPPLEGNLEEWIAELHAEAEKARRTGDDEQAELIMKTIITHQPGDQRATTFLERRYRANEDWQALRDLLVKCVHSSEYPAAVKTVRLRQAAKLAEENLSDVAGAIRIWYQIREHDPKVRDAKDALERLLTETERWDELAALISEEAEASTSRSKKIAAFQRLAQIYQNQMNNAALAAQAYSAIIELAPEDTDAVNALDELYVREQQFDQLVPFLDQRAEATHDKIEKKQLILRAASILQTKMGQYEQAYQKAKSVLEFLPGDIDTIDAMESADEDAENWERLIETLNLQARVTKETSDKVVAYKKVATIAAVRLADAALSLRAWNKVLEVDASDLEALDTVSQLYEEASEWQELVRVLKLRVDATPNDDGKISYYRKLAHVLQDNLGRTDESILQWKNLLKIEEDADALQALAKWHESREEWEALADVLARMVSLIDEAEQRSNVLFQRAELFYSRLGKKETAISELRSIKNDVNPAHIPTLVMLREVLAESGNYLEAAETLEQQIGYSQEKSELKSLYLQLGDWSRDQLGDLGRAMAAYEKAASLDISDDAVLDTLDAIFVEAGEWDKLLKMMYGRYQRSDDENVKYGYLVRGGQLCEEKLADQKQAWGWYRQLFDQMRHYEGALQVVEDAGHRMQLWKELIDVFGVMTREGTDTEKVVWWMKISEILEQKLDDPAQALEAVLRAFGLEPDNEAMLDSVDRLAVTGKAYDRLATVYAVLAKRAVDVDSKIAKLIRHARVLFENAGQASMAFDVALRAFELNPTSEEMLSFVEELGRASGRFEDMVKVYKFCADRVSETERKVEMLLRAATMFKSDLANGEGALERALEALIIAPFDQEVVAKVWSFIRLLEDDSIESHKGTYWRRLIAVYKQLVQATRRDADKQLELTLVISKIYAEELHEKKQAFGCLKEAQQLVPGDEKTIDKLEEMANELEMWDDLVQHYREILDDTFEMSTAVMYHRRRARILADKLNRSEDAAEHYWQIIQLDSQDARAYEELLHHYEVAQKWNDLVNLLERQLDAASDDEKRKELLLQIADIWEHKIGNKYEARDWYGQVANLWPGNEVAKAAIARLAATNKVGGFDDGDDEDDDPELRELVSIMPPAPVEPAGLESEADSVVAASEEVTDAASAEEAETDSAEEADAGSEEVAAEEAVEVAEAESEEEAEEVAEAESEEEAEEVAEAESEEEAEEVAEAESAEEAAEVAEAESEEEAAEVAEAESEEEAEEVAEAESEEVAEEVADAASEEEADESVEEALEVEDVVDSDVLVEHSLDDDDEIEMSVESVEEGAQRTASMPPAPPAPPRPPLPPRASVPPTGRSVAPPPPPPMGMSPLPAVPGVPRPPAVPASPSGIPAPPRPPAIGLPVPPPPPPKIPKP